MKIDVLTLFPEMFTAVTESSILGRAGEKGIINIKLINIRDYSRDKHNKADDTEVRKFYAFLLHYFKQFAKIEEY